MQAARLTSLSRLVSSQRSVLGTRCIHSTISGQQSPETAPHQTSTTPSPPIPISSRTTPIRPRPASSNPSPSIPSPSFTPLNARRPRRIITSVRDLPADFGRNQIVSVSPAMQASLATVMSHFKAPIRYAFAYGSAVFRQEGYSDADKPLLDFVFAVSHPSHWHAVNLAQNPTHYSPLMRLLGSDAVAWLQEKGIGAGVWFNVGVEVEGMTLKYGVISIDTLCRDLLDWETLYVSGRLHKPVRILQDDTRVRLAAQANLASAIRTSLLLLPEEFTEQSLFETIASLSYRGDFRMAVGEHPDKVANIVRAQLPLFRGLYGGLLKSFWKSLYVIGESPVEGGNGTIRLMRQDVGAEQRAQLARKLPVGVKGKVRAYYERKWNLKKALGVPGAELGGVLGSMEEVEVWERIVMDREFNVMLERSLAQIVGSPTFNQSLKGILSAGPIKSIRYILPKLQKKWGSRRPVATPLIEEKKEV